MKRILWLSQECNKHGQSFGPNEMTGWPTCLTLCLPTCAHSAHAIVAHENVFWGRPEGRVGILFGWILSKFSCLLLVSSALPTPALKNIPNISPCHYIIWLGQYFDNPEPLLHYMVCILVGAGTTEAVRPSERRTQPVWFQKLWGKSSSWRMKILPLWNGSSLNHMFINTWFAAPCKLGQDSRL